MQSSRQVAELLVSKKEQISRVRLCKYIDHDPTSTTTSGTLSYTGPATGTILNTEYEYGDSSIEVLQIYSTTYTVKGHAGMIAQVDWEDTVPVGYPDFLSKIPSINNTGIEFMAFDYNNNQDQTKFIKYLDNFDSFTISDNLTVNKGIINLYKQSSKVSAPSTLATTDKESRFDGVINQAAVTNEIGRIYINDDKQLYFMDEDGFENCISQAVENLDLNNNNLNTWSLNGDETILDTYYSINSYNVGNNTSLSSVCGLL